MNEYVFTGLLGEGGFANVHSVDRTIMIDGKENVSTYALKIMNKAILKKKMISEYNNEG